jgi:signal transduction histidine kinase
MSDLIEGLLALSKSGSQALKKSEVDVNAVVKEVVEEVRTLNNNRNLDITIDIRSTVYADRSLLQQVWFNLISNSVKFTNEKAEPKIILSEEYIPGFIKYSVKDNGIGFDMENMNEMFGVFKRFHSSQYTGSGVGLAIVKRIVTSHGGTITARSEPGKGAEFIFTIPHGGHAIL